MNLALVGNPALRLAIRQNLVSFPAQIPAFIRCGDLQERIASLYFIRGWQVRNLCDRYELGPGVVRKMLSEWSTRAIGAGYIQEIDPDAVETLVRRESSEPVEAAPVRSFGASAGLRVSC
jgi:hypothetical protein